MPGRQTPQTSPQRIIQACRHLAVCLQPTAMITQARAGQGRLSSPVGEVLDLVSAHAVLVQQDVVACGARGALDAGVRVEEEVEVARVCDHAVHDSACGHSTPNALEGPHVFPEGSGLMLTEGGLSRGSS